MNKTLLAIAVAAAASAPAFADTSVTLYGKIDTALQSVGHASAAGGKTTLGTGIFSGPRWGLKGNEDLGGGTAAIFQLEGGFNSGTGAAGQGGLLFGRQAYVGLKDASAGTLTLGRQYGLAFTTIGGYDPLGWGNSNENSYHAALTGVRYDNTIKYGNSFGGPVTVEVQYSAGGTAGSSAVGTTTALAANYSANGIAAGAATSTSKDVNSAKAQVTGLGGSFTMGANVLFLHYINSQRDAGFNKNAASTPAALGNASLLNNTNATAKRTDKLVTVGANIGLGAPTLLLGYMNDSISNVTDTTDGKIGTLYAYVDYALSKRTDVYFGVDHTKLTDGAVAGNGLVGTFGGSASRNVVSLGLRHVF